MILNMCGGNNLNLSVITCESYPEFANINTIAVLTNVEAPNWIFSTTEPVDPIEGTIWFATGKSSIVELNILRKNTLNVYPVLCHQYIDGIWVEKEAATYTDEGWTYWLSKYVWNYGNAYYGWVDKPVSTTGESSNLIKSNKEDGSVLWTSDGNSSVLRTLSPINITEFNKMIFNGKMFIDLDNAGYSCGLYIWTEPPVVGSGIYTNNTVISFEIDKTEENMLDDTTMTFDVSSLNGEFYVGFGLKGRCGVKLNTLNFEI